MYWAKVLVLFMLAVTAGIGLFTCWMVIRMSHDYYFVLPALFCLWVLWNVIVRDIADES